MLSTYLMNTLFSVVLFLGLCTFFFGIQGVLSPREGVLCVFYILKFLSAAEAAASQAQYFPLFGEAEGLPLHQYNTHLGKYCYLFLLRIWTVKFLTSVKGLFISMNCNASTFAFAKRAC